MRCCVEKCKNKRKFTFPKVVERKNKWLEAIRRPDFNPKSWDGLCAQHFTQQDFRTESFEAGYKLQRLCLKKNAVPSIFSWSCEDSENLNVDNSDINTDVTVHRVEEIEEENPEHDWNAANEIDYGTNCDLSIALSVEIEENSVSCDLSNGCDNEKQKLQNKSDPVKNTCDKETQIYVSALIGIENLKNNAAAILHFTGLENYDKFKIVFCSLDPKVDYIEYEGNRSFGGLSLENQLFLTLWKLRHNCADLELSIFFGITRTAVGNIFKAWIKFMAKQWSRIDIWPSKELTQYYMPTNFKEDFPQTRVIIDGTEIHVQRPHNPKHQQSLFSHYKNDTTLKTVIGNTPGGLISYRSPLYAGSTSDRQVVERSELFTKCEPGDTIMDRKLSKYRVHVERVIGLLKPYKIMSTQLNHNYISIASEITGVCVMLCNFKECIMKRE